jgi:hypothetical protein
VRRSRVFPFLADCHFAGQAAPADPGLEGDAGDKGGNGVCAGLSLLTLSGTSDGTCGHDGAMSTVSGVFLW